MRSSGQKNRAGLCRTHQFADLRRVIGLRGQILTYRRAAIASDPLVAMSSGLSGNIEHLTADYVVLERKLLVFGHGQLCDHSQAKPYSANIGTALACGLVNLDAYSHRLTRLTFA